MDLVTKIELFINEKTTEIFYDDTNRNWGIDHQKEIGKAQQEGNMLVAIGGSYRPKYIQWEFLSLNNFDKDYVKGYKLKADERIFRIPTRGGFATPLVKVNIKRGLVYFLTDRANEEDIVEFESKGTKLDYLRLVKGKV